MDFKKLKEEIGFAEVLDKMEILEFMVLRGDEFVGECPFHKSRNRSFFANGRKGLFRCMECHKKGNIIDFVMFYKGVDVKEAGLWLESMKEGKKVSIEKDDFEEKLHEVITLLLKRVGKNPKSAERITRLILDLI